MLLCSVVGMWDVVSFDLSVMRVVEGILLWVICVSRSIYVVCWCLLTCAHSCNFEWHVLCYL